MKRAVSYLQPSGMTPRSHFAAVPKDVSLRNAGEKNMVQNEVVPKSGVQLEITNEKPLCPGNPIEVVIIVKSTVAGSWTVDLASSCQLQSYTGKVHANLGYIKQTVKVEGQSGRHGNCDMLYRLFTPRAICCLLRIFEQPRLNTADPQQHDCSVPNNTLTSDEYLTVFAHSKHESPSQKYTSVSLLLVLSEPAVARGGDGYAGQDGLSKYASPRIPPASLGTATSAASATDVLKSQVTLSVPQRRVSR